MPEISIITTFYDAVDYLPLTVKAILASTFTDFELLLVDDGGPNNAGAVCDELAKTDSRIRVFHKPNGGPASASNVGLRNAKGRYVAFVDSDDIIEPTMLETLYNAIREHGCPIAACGADCIDAKGAPLPGFNEVQCSLTGKIDALMLWKDAFEYGSFYGPLSWNKLVDIRLWRDKGIEYDETMIYGDDASVLHLVFEGAEAWCTNDKLYHYRSRKGSQTALSFRDSKLDDLTMYRAWIEFFRERPQYDEVYRRGLARYWQMYYYFYHEAHADGNFAGHKAAFAPHFAWLKEQKTLMLACPYITDFEKKRLQMFCAAPEMTYGLASLWGKLHGGN